MPANWVEFLEQGYLFTHHIGVYKQGDQLPRIFVTTFDDNMQWISEVELFGPRYEAALIGLGQHPNQAGIEAAWTAQASEVLSLANRQKALEAENNGLQSSTQIEEASRI